MKRLLLALMLVFFVVSSAQADGLLQRFRDRFSGRGVTSATPERALQTTADIVHIAGLTVAIWTPPDTGIPAPLVLFSHGFGGCKTQSTFLMEALAATGYVVVAPDHKDALCGSGSPGIHKPEQKFRDYAAWNENTYQDRRDDIKRLYAAMHADPQWQTRIDWKHVALAGHSLGGYTVLGLAGAWPSWKMPEARAVLALSPYVGPYLQSGGLAHLGVPVMYQGGTRDMGITPGIRKQGGAYDQTSAPAAFVEFKQAGHFGWTDLQDSAHDAIINYSVWFLAHALYDDPADPPDRRANNVNDWRIK